VNEASNDVDCSEPHTEDAVDRWVMPYVRDSTLWPVLLVVMAHVMAFVAPVLLYAIRDHHLAAFAALAGTLYLTFGVIRYDVRRSRRPAALSIIVLVIWAASIAAAYYGNRTGFL